MIYQVHNNQFSSGEAIGILLLETSVPFIPGDVANATTYRFPVRFRPVEGFTVARALGKDATVYTALKEAAGDLVDQGVRAVTGDCGFMALHQKTLAEELDVPVFLSSLLQIPFMLSILGEDSRIGVITADSRSLDRSLLAAVGVTEVERIAIVGLEEQPHFYDFAIKETGTLEPAKVEEEVVAVGRHLVKRDPKVKALLLECSLLPPYAAALQAAVNLPVFDYISMINHVFAAVVKRPYQGFV
jgi:hypothetical protein